MVASLVIRSTFESHDIYEALLSTLCAPCIVTYTIVRIVLCIALDLRQRETVNNKLILTIMYFKYVIKLFIF